MRIHPLFLLVFVLFPLMGRAEETSTDSLFSAGQPSLTDNMTIMLFATSPFTTETVSKRGNFTISPSRTVDSVTWDTEMSSMVKLNLNASTPLEPGTAYTVTVVGSDIEGKDYDSSLMTKSFKARSLQYERENILGSVLPSGAINIKRESIPWASSDPIRIVPYFSAMAVNGLVSYAQMCDPAFSDVGVCDNYIAWHMAHMDSETGYINDYNGTYSNIIDSGDCDSTDSYGALFVIMVWRQFVLTQDVTKLAARWDAVKLAVTTMMSTRDAADNLTNAKPTYPIKYAMDNSEGWQGFLCAAQIARVLGNTTEYAQYLAMAQSTEAAIKNIMWSNLETGPWRYVVGKDNGGNLFGSWAAGYYPDGMANDMVLDTIHYPNDARMATGWASTCNKYIMSDYVPAASVEQNAVRLAARLGDTAARDRAWAATLTSHNTQKYSFISGHLLDIARLENKEKMSIANVDSVSAINWDTASKLVFHPVGTRIDCFDNTYTGNTASAAINADTLYILRAAHVGRSLVLKLTAYDSHVDRVSGLEGISALKINGQSFGGAVLTSDGTSVTNGEASATLTSNGYELLWTVPMGDAASESVSFNVACTDVYADGATEMLALSDPSAPATYTVELKDLPAVPVTLSGFELSQASLPDECLAYGIPTIR